PQYTGVEVTATLLLKVYRWWGYAPELLALGVSGYTTFADYRVLKDREDGVRITLSQLAHSIDFKRQPYPASFHHAASFVKWLIRKHGVPQFRELYGKATDLSFERALFSVYGQTLAEMEDEWLGYLRQRDFRPGEYYDYAKRAAAYHRYQDHYNLLQLAEEGHHDPPVYIYRSLTLAAAQLGKWDSAVDYAYQLAERQPTETNALSLLAEVQWAAGDLSGAQYHLLRITEMDENDARPYITLGDIQHDQRRTDSARVLWETGLTKTEGRDPSALELLLRLGRWQRAHRDPDSARVLFDQALALAQSLVSKTPSGARPFTRLGETLMEVDSLTQALAYLETAAFVADAPQELGRALINLGRCHDLAGRRESAITAYEAVFQIPATYYHQKLAKRYVNAIYSH
ncbi:MAG: tetratricopeptide repeat protein, partial [candidate division Zixibacteria bacterium]|nr:tetratricopeptide repeat protein [candidate division Zixibacteria bacterium]